MVLVDSKNQSYGERQGVIIKIINIIRDQMREMAVKWGLTYNED